MKVLLAINYPQIVDQIEKESGMTITPASDVCYIDAVRNAIEKDKPNVLIMSAFLHGADMQKYYDAVFAAKESNVRVILLAGSLDKNDPMLCELVKLGVYDVLFNPCSVDKILELIKKPSTFSDVSDYFKADSAKSMSIRPSVYVDENNKGGGGKSGLVAKIKSRIAQKSFPETNSNSDEYVSRTHVQDSGIVTSANNESAPVKVADIPSELDNEKLVEKTNEMNAQIVAASLCESNDEEGKSDVDKKIDNKNKIQNMQLSILEQKTMDNVGPRKNVEPVKKPVVYGGKNAIVACYSPYSTGKTFTAVNLAMTAMKNGEKTSLIDLDFNKMSIYGWLNISEQPDSIYEFLSGKEDSGANYGELDVYGATVLSEVKNEEVLPNMNDILSSLRKKSFVVMDMPSVLTFWHKELLDLCTSVIVVADPDCNNYTGVSSCIKQFNNVAMVVNKHVETGAPFSYKDIFGVEPVVRIPLLGQVYRSILFGEPLVISDNSVLKLFNVLYQTVRWKKREVVVPKQRFLASR